MDTENLIKLMEAVETFGLTDFLYEENGVKVRVSRKGKKDIGYPEHEAGIMTLPEEAADRQLKKTEAPSGKIVKSPLVGTFYAAPSEDADAFVAVGDIVKKGQVLGIVEAMKLMNEIESDYDGAVAEILVENGQAVEYGQPLFRIQ